MNIRKSFIVHPSLLIIALTSSSVTLITILGLMGMWKTATGFLGNITQFFRHEITSPHIDDPYLILKQIQNVSELTTSVFVMDTIVPTSSSRKIGNWVVGETNLLYVARGEVKAGLNLDKISPDDIVIDTDKIKIKLPPVEILDEKIDVNQSQVYDYDRGFLNLGPDVAPQLQSQAQKATLVKIKESACQNKILEEANDKAVILITQLMNNAGFSTVEVTTTPSEDCQGITTK